MNVNDSNRADVCAQAASLLSATDPEQQLRVDPAALGPNNRRGRINFAQFRFERLDLLRLYQIDFVQKQNVRTLDLQPCGVAKLGEANEHVGVDY